MMHQICAQRGRCCPTVGTVAFNGTPNVSQKRTFWTVGLDFTFVPVIAFASGRLGDRRTA